MSQKHNFLLSYGDDDYVSKALENPTHLSNTDRVLNNPTLHPRHVKKILETGSESQKDAAMVHAHADPDTVKKIIDDRVKHDRRLYETGGIIKSSRALTKEHLSDLMRNSSESIASRAYENSNAPHREAMDSKHPQLRSRAIMQHATPSELHGYIKSGDVGDAISAMSARHTAPEHIDTAIKHIPKSDGSPAQKMVKSMYLEALGSVMVHHGRVKDLPEEHRGSRLYIEHKRVVNMGVPDFKKLHKNFKVTHDPISDSNAVDILTSHPHHINSALSAEPLFGNTRYNSGYHLLMAHPSITDETLKKVGTEAARSNDSDGHMLSVAAAMHKNASPETKKAIADAASDRNRYKSQLERIVKRG